MPTVVVGTGAPAPTTCTTYFGTHVLVRFVSRAGDARACVSWVRAPAHRGRWTLAPRAASHAAFRVCHLADGSGDTVTVYDDHTKGEKVASAACVRLLASGRWSNAATAVP